MTPDMQKRVVSGWFAGFHCLITWSGQQYNKMSTEVDRLESK